MVKLPPGYFYFIDKNNQQWLQPADIVILSAFQMQNVRLLLLSQIGMPYDHKTKKGVVGRTYIFPLISV